MGIEVLYSRWRSATYDRRIRTENLQDKIKDLVSTCTSKAGCLVFGVGDASEPYMSAPVLEPYLLWSQDPGKGREFKESKQTNGLLIRHLDAYKIRCCDYQKYRLRGEMDEIPLSKLLQYQSIGIEKPITNQAQLFDAAWPCTGKFMQKNETNRDTTYTGESQQIHRSESTLTPIVCAKKFHLSKTLLRVASVLIHNQE